jgi:hypothetical protein
VEKNAAYYLDEAIKREADGDVTKAELALRLACVKDDAEHRANPAFASLPRSTNTATPRLARAA